MSILHINKLFQNKGCNIAMSALLGIATIMMLGAGFRGCGSTNQNQAQEEASVVKVGDYKITSQDLDDLTNSMLQQRSQFTGQDPMNATDAERADAESSALNQQITNGLALILAKQQGLDMSDNALKKTILDANISAARTQLESAGKLKPGASEQQFEDAFKAVNGLSLIDARKNLESQVDKGLAEKPVETRASLAYLMLANNAKSKFTPSDDEIKKENFENFHFKMLAFDPTKSGKQTVKQLAQDVLKQIKGGSLTFEAAMDKYAIAPPAKGKKPSDQTQDFKRIQLENSTALKPLLNLKPGDVSDVISFQPSDATIYKLIDSKLEVPKDFSAQKSKLVSDMESQQSAKYVNDEIKKIDTPDNVKWSNDGYRLLRQYAVIMSDNNLTPEQRGQQCQDVIKAAMKLQNDPESSRAALSAALVCLPVATSQLPTDDAAKLKVDVLSAYVAQSPDVAEKIELAKAYVDMGDKTNTFSSLKDAADSEVAHLDQQGQTDWTQIDAYRSEALKKGLITPDQAKQLDAERADWNKSFVAEQEQEAAAEAHQKAMDEELSKQGQAQPKAGTDKNKPGAGSGKAAPSDKGAGTSKPSAPENRQSKSEKSSGKP